MSLLASFLGTASPIHAKSGAIGVNGQGTLLFIGDSLSVGANAFGSLPARVRASSTWTQLTMDARDGRTASAGASVLKKRLTKSTTAIVIALGTNDMISKSESWYPSWVIDKVMTEAKGRPVLWVNLEFSATSRKDWRLRATRFNKALSTSSKRWPNLTVADWNTHFTPNRVSRFIADGVHLTVTGYRTRATFALKQITQFGMNIVDATTTTTPVAAPTTVEQQTTIPSITDPSSTVSPTTASPTTTPPSSPPNT